MSYKPSYLFICALICLSFSGCGSGPSMTSSPPPAPLATGQSNDRLSVIQSRIAKVYLVVLENLSYSDVAGSPSMPYWNSLAAQNGVATNFFANDHGSIGEYF